MPDALSPPTVKALRSICRKVQVAHQLGDSIERELYGHLEDKLLGYLSGAEKISEADALLLVEKHFGDPAVIQSLLRDVHRTERSVEWLSRLGAIAVATLAIDICTRLLLQVARRHSPEDPYAMYGFPLYHVVQTFLFAAGTVALWGLMVRWARTEAAARSPWYARRPRMVGSLILVLVPPQVAIAQLLVQPLPYESPMLVLVVMIQMINFCIWAMRGFFWISWTSKGSRRRAATWTAAAAWVAFAGLPFCVEAVRPVREHPTLIAIVIQYFALFVVIGALIYVAVYEGGKAVWRLGSDARAVLAS